MPGSENHFLSRRADCEGQLPTGLVGHAWTDPGEGRVPIYRCLHPEGGRHLASGHEDCEGWIGEGLLGYGRR